MSATLPLPDSRPAPDAVWRRDIYALLAALLGRAPSAELMGRLGELTPGEAVPGPLGEALEAVREAARGGSAGAVEAEYADLFVGLGRGAIVPYASWYAERLLQAGPLARLRTDLAALALRRRRGVCEPEDHAAALCESMRLLIDRPGLTGPAQAAFFQAHLAPWMIRFFRDLQAAPGAAFYRAVGRLGERFLRLEHQHLPPQTVEEV